VVARRGARGCRPRGRGWSTASCAGRRCNRIVAGDEGPAARAVFRYVLEPGSLVMERKMLRGIKHRAEWTELGVEVGGAVPGSAA
jgi:hypothetical protein